MPTVDLDPESYRRADRPKIIPRRIAVGVIILHLAGCAFLQWLVGRAGPDYWAYGFLVWPGLIYAGGLITRVWPLLLTRDD